MARPLRIEYPGAYYHVTGHGVAGQMIFLADTDRLDFLELLGEAHERWGVVFHGYCLMGNHYHLEIACPEGHLSRPMQWINHRYAAAVNRAHGRAGHLFQGRFKSALVEAETHLQELTRYIHLNPVRAGLADHPADYPWSSYRAYLGAGPRPQWLDTAWTLARFGGRPALQRERYRAFVEAPKEVVQNPLRDLAYGAIVGSRDFVDRVRADFSEEEADPEVARAATFCPAPDLDCIRLRVAQVLGAEEDALVARGAHGNRARDLAVYVARRCSRRRLADIGDYFGGIRSSAASLACRRIERSLAEEPELRAVLSRILESIQPVDGAPDQRRQQASGARGTRPSRGENQISKM